MARTWKDRKQERESRQPKPGDRVVMRPGRMEAGQQWAAGGRLRRVRSGRLERAA